MLQVEIQGIELSNCSTLSVPDCWCPMVTKMWWDFLVKKDDSLFRIPIAIRNTSLEVFQGRLITLLSNSRLVKLPPIGCTSSAR